MLKFFKKFFITSWKLLPDICRWVASIENPSGFLSRKLIPFQPRKSPYPSVMLIEITFSLKECFETWNSYYQVDL